MRTGARRWGRFGCALEIMLGILFSMLHAGVAWRISSWWPAVFQLPPGSPRRVLFSIYWWPPNQLLGLAAGMTGAPQGGITDLMLLPLGWVTCLCYGFLTSVAICLPFRLLRRR